MRFERFLIVLLVASGCPAEEQNGPAPGRFAAVKKNTSEKASRIFCEKSYASGERKWTAPAQRTLPPGAAKDRAGTGWRWINFWATWCGPCLKEMPLLGRWQKALNADGLEMRFELWSVDEEAEALARSIRTEKRFPPGGMFWIEGSDALPGVFDMLGIGTDSAIPVHALVDPAGDLRCVRVGAVGEGDYGTVKTILASYSASK